MLFPRLILFSVLIGIVAITGHVEFNNVKCVVYDKKFMDYEYCYLKSVNRTYKYVSLKTIFYNLPIRKSKVEYNLMNRDTRKVFEYFNGFVDACKFMKYGQNPIATLLYSVFKDYSNLNHTCPYNHNVILEKLPIQHVNRVIHSFIPEGRYFLNLSWILDNVLRTDTILYFTNINLLIVYFGKFVQLIINWFSHQSEASFEFIKNYTIN